MKTFLLKFSFLLLLFFFKRKEGRVLITKGETPLVVSPLSTLSKFTLSGAYERFSFLGAAQTRKPFKKGLAKIFTLGCCENLLAKKIFLLTLTEAYEDISSKV